MASIFDVVHDHGGSTALYATKHKFQFYVRSWNVHGAPDRVGSDDGRAKIDNVVIERDDDRAAGALVDSFAHESGGLQLPACRPTR